MEQDQKRHLLQLQAMVSSTQLQMQYIARCLEQGEDESPVEAQKYQAITSAVSNSDTLLDIFGVFLTACCEGVIDLKDFSLKVTSGGVVPMNSTH